MLTQEEYKAVLTNPVSHSAFKLIEFLKSQGLTPTTDIADIKEELKHKLFKELLEVDPGLKARYGQARTDDAKRQLLNQSVNLDGYTEIKQATELISLYLRDYKSVWNHRIIGNPLTNHGVSAEGFITDFDGDIEVALKDHVIDLSEDSSYKKIIQLAKSLNTLLEEDVIQPGWNGHELSRNLQYLLPFNAEKGRVEVNEAAAYERIKAKKK